MQVLGTEKETDEFWDIFHIYNMKNQFGLVWAAGQYCEKNSL